jgi:F-type H+-transporting ATPase subunit a
MFLLSESGGHHEPLIVEFVNHYLGKPVHQFQVDYTKPIWGKVLGYFGTTPEAVFGAYTPENAIPWYTVMFAIACLLTFAIIWVLKGKLSEGSPKNGQLTLEAGVITLQEMVKDIIGEQGMKYFPVVATFAILILISNLMGFFPLFMPPSAHVSVTFALAISSFIYYNYIGISENGLYAHVAHLAGPNLGGVLTFIVTPFIFVIEVISNFIRPLSLGIRLFGNIFADEQVAATVAGLSSTLGFSPIWSQLIVPIPLMILGLLVCVIQAFVFTLLSMIYLSEVSHGEHDHEEGHLHEEPAHA